MIINRVLWLAVMVNGRSNRIKQMEVNSKITLNSLLRLAIYLTLTIDFP